MKTLPQYTINDWNNPSFWRSIERAFAFYHRTGIHSRYHKSRFAVTPITQNGICWAIKYLIHNPDNGSSLFNTPYEDNCNCYGTRAHILLNRFKETIGCPYWPPTTPIHARVRALLARRIARFLTSCKKRNLDPLTTPIDFFKSKKKVAATV